jgi:hypothetical protein
VDGSRAPGRESCLANLRLDRARSFRNGIGLRIRRRIPPMREVSLQSNRKRMLWHDARHSTLARCAMFSQMIGSSGSVEAGGAGVP